MSEDVVHPARSTSNSVQSRPAGMSSRGRRVVTQHPYHHQVRDLGSDTWCHRLRLRT
jgi:hypothetical protein